MRVQNLKSKQVFVEVFDAVMICNGHYFEPKMPKIEGDDLFKGDVLHSHDYRIPESFTGKKVVVFGAGPSGNHHTAAFHLCLRELLTRLYPYSGMDLALEISKKADRVILSHHLKTPILTKFPDNVIQVGAARIHNECMKFRNVDNILLVVTRNQTLQSSEKTRRCSKTVPSR